MARELLSLRSLPSLAEVDAIQGWLEGKEIEFGVVRRIKRLIEMVTSLAAAAEEQRKRADEAEKDRETQCQIRYLYHDENDELKAQLTERDAEIERLKKGSDELRQSYEFIVEQNRERIATLTAERDEARRLIADIQAAQERSSSETNENQAAGR